MTPRDYIYIARERWRFIVAGVLLGLLVAGAVSYFIPRQYQASVTLIVSTQPTADTSSSDAGEISSQRLRTYVELLHSERLATGVTAQLALPVTPAELAERITVVNVPDSVLLTATVTDGSADNAVRIANAVADQFIRSVAEIEQPVDPLRPPQVVAKIFEPARPPAVVSAPRPLLYLALGLALGLLGGAAGALLRNALDTSVKRRDQLEDVLQAPVLGHTGRDPKISASPLVIYGDPQAPLAEAYRQLRTNVQFVDVDRAHKVVLVTSPSLGEGKSITVCNLALALAEAGTRVLIIDADLRRPSIARWLKIDGTVGLTTVLVNRVPAQRAVQALAPALDVLPSGLMPPNPSELLASDRMVHLLRELRDSYDLILIDASPLLPVTDAAVLAPRADGVLLVVRHGKTKVQDLQSAKDALDAVSGRVLGAVMTMAPYVGKHLDASNTQSNWKQRPVSTGSRRPGRPEQQPPKPTPGGPPTDGGGGGGKERDGRPPSPGPGAPVPSGAPQLAERGGGGNPG